MNFCLRKLVAAALLAGAASTASAVDRLVIFGDSLSDTGNAAALVGINGAQVVTGNSYIPGQPYASGQFTNGDVWAKTFANALGLGSFAQPWLTSPGGSNYAFGGARVATDGVDQPPSLSTQVGQFLGNSGVMPNTLFVLEGGGNDARDALQAAAAAGGDPATTAAVITFAATTYAQKIGDLVDQLQAAPGAQEIVVWNVPNLALAPAVTIQGPGAIFLADLVVQAMNAALAARLASESDLLLFDVFGVQNSFTANAASLGLANVTDACGAVPNCDPSTYLFWDGIHPTSAGHALLAQAMLDQTGLVAAVPEPETYALLLAGLATVGVFSRRRKQRTRAV